jgi:hypothetical protein
MAIPLCAGMPPRWARSNAGVGCIDLAALVRGPAAFPAVRGALTRLDSIPATGLHYPMRRPHRDEYTVPPLSRIRDRAPAGPVPTLAQMHKSCPWLWVWCDNRPECRHRAPMTVVPLMIRWGPDASSDKLRRSARCTRCGHKGASLQHPSAGPERARPLSVPDGALSVCNLYSLTKGQAAIRKLARAMRDHTGNLPPLPGIFPDQMAPIVRTGEDGERELLMMRWGFPSPPVFGNPRPVTNVRNVKSAYWKPWLKPEQRCLVPATSFCEYTTSPIRRRSVRRRSGSRYPKSARCFSSRVSGEAGKARAARRRSRSRASICCTRFSRPTRTRT